MRSYRLNRQSKWPLTIHVLRVNPFDRPTEAMQCGHLMFEFDHPVPPVSRPVTEVPANRLLEGIGHGQYRIVGKLVAHEH